MSLSPRTASNTAYQYGRHRTTSNATTASSCCSSQITHHARTSASHGRVPTPSQSTSKPAARSALSTISSFSSFSRRPETLARRHHERHTFFLPRRTEQCTEQQQWPRFSSRRWHSSSEEVPKVRRVRLQQNDRYEGRLHDCRR